LTPVKITQDVIEEIKSRLDIVDVASERISLKKTGSNYKGVCPFHSEKTPSFIVNPDKQIFHCFGCHVGGDVISFVEKIENITFYEAIIKLAELAGVTLPTVETSYEEKKLQDKKQQLLNINIIARDHYISRLRTPGNKAHKYATLRGISEEIMSTFSIGYAPEEWDSLSTMLTKKGLPLGNAVSLGLIKETNGKYYDTFRDRLMFPILNHRGDVLAFGGRILEPKEDAPKYINSRESELYKKGEVLYGLYQTNKYIRDMGYAVVVEGYMDFISLYQAGIKNAVATLGTAFTDRQVGLIKRYTDRIVLFYDSDDAGINAAKRSFLPLLESGLKVDALFLEDQMDPDDAVQKLGKEELENRLKKAKPLIGKIISDKFSEQHRTDDLAKITKEILGYLALIPDNVSRTFWLKELSIRSGLSTKELSGLLVNYARASKQGNNTTVTTKNTSYSKVKPLYKNLIKTLFMIPQLSARVFDEGWDEYIPEDIRGFISKVKALVEQRETLTISDWLYVSNEAGFDWFESFLTKEFIDKKENDGMNLEREFSGCMVRFKMLQLERKRMDNLRKIKEGENSENALREYKAIVQEINRLKPMLGVLE